MLYKLTMQKLGVPIYINSNGETITYYPALGRVIYLWEEQYSHRLDRSIELGHIGCTRYPLENDIDN